MKNASLLAMSLWLSLEIKELRKKYTWYLQSDEPAPMALESVREGVEEARNTWRFWK